MIQITIKKQGKITNGPVIFETQELADAWLAKEVENKSFGKNDRWVREERLSEEEKLESTAQRKVVVVEASEDVEEISYQEYFMPKKYEVIVEDISVDFEAERTKKEQRELKRSKAKDDLKKVDWSKVTKVADIVPILKAIYEKIED